jgi:signal transduction histidine kinase
VSETERRAIESAVTTIVDVSAAMGREGRETLAPGIVADLVRIHGASLRLKRLLALLMQDPAPLVELFARSGVRHELNTPLNHVIGYSELLLEEETTPAFVTRSSRSSRTRRRSSASSTAR